MSEESQDFDRQIEDENNNIRMEYEEEVRCVMKSKKEKINEKI